MSVSSQQQRVEFLDVSSFASLGPRCPLAPKPIACRHPNPDTFRSTWLCVPGSNLVADVLPLLLPPHLPGSLRACGGRRSCFCLMTDGPASSKCDLTLIKSVTPLRSSISWKRIDHKSPLDPCTRSPLCAMACSSRISHQSEFGCSSSHRVSLGMAELGPWNRPLAAHCLPLNHPDSQFSMLASGSES